MDNLVCGILKLSKALALNISIHTAIYIYIYFKKNIYIKN